MAHLSLSLVGPFRVTLDGTPCTDFKSSKVRALLAYLAVEADRLHPRETLAGLLWPDWPDRDALSNLRYALSDLRRTIGDRESDPPFLLITHTTLQFNTASDHWLDVAAFNEMVTDPSAVDRLEQAVDLYRGEFLEGFSVADSAAFEEWVRLSREQLARQVSLALHHLAAAYQERGDYEQAQATAWHRIELEPWDETAHQQLMRALALGGQRSAALAQYETCRRRLAQELGVEPAAETTRLYEQIRNDEFKTFKPLLPLLDSPMQMPPFLAKDPPPVERPLFVAREHELAQLNASLDQALTGRGRVVFVTGEAGSGKTALVQEFARRAQAAHPELIVASGNCNAYTGIGDPYLPFREILELLTGDVAATWAAGTMTREHARRLWNLLPLATVALVEHGPDLIDTFVLHGTLRERALTFAQAGGDWVACLERLLERKLTGPSLPNPQQIAIFQQYTRVLQALALQAPLVLMLDDLQWADAGSISLLFHIGRQLTGIRVLIVGAYRPEEVALGREGTRHPLEPVVNELQRDSGDIAVNVNRAEGRDFVRAFLDSEPNRLGPSFRAMLYRQTQGHPLFTIELLRGLQERGDLVQDPEGYWSEGPSLDWETLPARVEAVIAERVGRLAEPLRSTLRVASVEGESFTANVVARVLGTDERSVVQRLSSELDRRHRLVRAQSIERLGTRRISRYRFGNHLFQRYMYDDMDEVERAYLHEDVGNALEELYAGHTSEIAAIAPQLAWHFREAGIADKTVDYLQQAGEKALQLTAYQEAVAHLNQGVTLLGTLPDTYERAQKELELQISLGIAWKGELPGIEGEKAFTRARELCQQLGKTRQLCQVLGELLIFPYVRAEYQKARELAEEALSLAQQTGDPLLVLLSHWHLGFILFGVGEYILARTQFEKAIDLYDPQQHHQAIVSLSGSDAGVGALAYDACCLWCLGYPDQALRRSRKVLALARELNHPLSLADALCFGGCLFNEMRRDAQGLKEDGEALLQLSREMWFLSFGGIASCYRGAGLARLGQAEEGIAQIREAVKDMLSIDARCYLTGVLGALGEAQAKTGRLEEGLATLAKAFAFVEETDERYWEAELHRLKGELLLAQGIEAEAETSFQRAIEVARRQQAKSWELRATTSLCHLWQRQGKGEQARQLLEGIYGWFTEGFGTPDLVEARALLEELS